MADRIIADVVKRQAEDDGWKRGYVPHPKTYLNQELWTDDICPVPRAATPRYETADERRRRELRAWAQQQARLPEERHHATG
jgi:hypothetical protein